MTVTRSDDTICALSTADAPAAVGIVRLSGPRARALLLEVCGLRRIRPRHLRLARLRDPASGETLDQALVCFMPGPRSYTGEDLAEVQAHGGRLNLQRILQLFIALGARAAQPGELTRRAFLNGRLDLTQAEAVAEVIAARSEQALRNAQALLGGALGQRLQALRAELLELCAELEAEIDFADELTAGAPEPARPPQRQLSRYRALHRALDQLARTYHRGRRLNGARITLVGPVNVGKSSLLNALLGRERALVSTQPGTTRDYLEVEVSWDGRPLTLVDTAGQRGPQDEADALERAGQALARDQIRQSDLLLQVVDSSQAQAAPPAPLPHEAASSGQQLLQVANKIDLLPAAERAARLQQLHGAVPTSALTGEGLRELRQRVLELLFPAQAQPGQLQLTQLRQFEALSRAARAVARGAEAVEQGLPPELTVEHGREALAQLDGLSGQHHSEEVLDAVFARFCIGK